MATTPRGAPYPVGSDNNDGPGAFLALATWTQDRPGIQTVADVTARDALAGADLWAGRVVYVTADDSLHSYNGTAWTALAADTSLKAPIASPTFTGTPTLPLVKFTVLDPSGAGFALKQATGTFESGLYSDTTTNWGYNVSATPGVKAVATEPMVFWQLESKFRQSSGSPYGSECHLDFQRPSLAGMRRPINVFMEHVLDLVDVSISADTFAIASASTTLMNFGAGLWYFSKPVNITGGASAASKLTIGDALNHAQLILNAQSPTYGNTIEFQRGGVSRWLIYDANSADLYLRNVVNSRSHMLFIAGASNDASYTDIYSLLRVRGHSVIAGATGQVTMGTNGTAEGWLDSTVNLNLRAQGVNSIISLSRHRFDGNIGFYTTTPIAKQTGVAVTAAAIHAALVALGLIGA